eukprot:TRINITY_DN99383_c0_g1_i1.p1 TRINITY_DN99383_c0_g1~~TRINITY_DN99383_c0_g1_i1.p1  ORF type:complete len:244 (+),score=29.72 TRINITY_DN99383_c0_g1_i1:63-794(+)
MMPSGLLGLLLLRAFVDSVAISTHGGLQMEVNGNGAIIRRERELESGRSSDVALLEFEDSDEIAVDSLMSMDQPCDDKSDTGIRLKNGSKAFCSGLSGFCNHKSLGERVRTACPRRCGLCEIEVDSQSPDCVDGKDNEKPIFYLQNKVMSCIALKFFCRTDLEIANKCNLTCGRCGGSPAKNLTKDLGDSKNSTNDINVSNTSFNSSNSSNLTPAEAAISAGVLNCNRRRNMGFCYMRRRRAA